MLQHTKMGVGKELFLILEKIVFRKLFSDTYFLTPIFRFSVVVLIDPTRLSPLKFMIRDTTIVKSILCQPFVRMIGGHYFVKLLNIMKRINGLMSYSLLLRLTAGSA